MTLIQTGTSTQVRSLLIYGDSKRPSVIPEQFCDSISEDMATLIINGAQDGNKAITVAHGKALLLISQ